MQVVLAGASGLIGTALAQSLRAGGHSVKTLRREPVSGPDVDSWDPATGMLDPDFLRDADAVVCLSGAGVGAHRWTDSYKREILRSRVDSVATIARSLAEYGGPRIFLAASAVGYYGDTGDREVDEDSASGDTFLADVCRQWEAAAEPARVAGVRVASLRSGVVLAPGGGALKPLVLVAKLGGGGKLGNGRQYMPWISLTDEVAAIRFLLDHDVSGPVNLCAPTSVTNAELTKTLGSVLHRPTLLTVPSVAARFVLGEFAGDLLTGQRAVPRRLMDAGFSFAHADLRGALEAELHSAT